MHPNLVTCLIDICVFFFLLFFSYFLTGDVLVAQQNWKEQFLIIKVHGNNRSKMQKQNYLCKIIAQLLRLSVHDSYSIHMKT